MRINQNVAALNAWRNLTATDSAMNKSLERLSSGLRINRAADDAAGLAISEKMRGQIKGLNQAMRNSQDGISMIQTAEGALSQTHSILQRMRELAVQSASDTLTAGDRAEIQKEVENLLEEIDRIANTTEFNAKKLLNGDVSGAKNLQGTILTSVETQVNTEVVGTAVVVAADYSGANNASFTIAVGDDPAEQIDLVGDHSGGTAADVLNEIQTEIAGSALNGKVTADLDAAGHLVFTAVDPNTSLTLTDGANTPLVTDFGIAAGTYNNNTNLLTSLKDANGNSFGLAVGDVINIDAVVGGSSASSTYTIQANSTLGDLLTQIQTVTGGTATLDNSTGIITITGMDGTANAIADLELSVTDKALFNNKFSAFEETQAAADAKGDTSVTLHVGANAGQNISVGINAMSVQSLGLSSVAVETQQQASTAITVLDRALTTVSDERANLGAVQNRLEYTITNLSTAAENLTAAESRIRDADMASEMTQFTRNQILIQAGTAMLAQANQKTQSVLQLLR